MESSVVDSRQLSESIGIDTIIAVVSPVRFARVVEEAFDTNADQVKRVKGLDVFCSGVCQNAIF